MSNDLEEFNEKKIDLIKNTICKNATTHEFDFFIHTCKRLGLDPILRQIHFVKMGGQMTIQTGIDGYRLIAERTKKYMPGRDTTYVYDKAGKLFSATSYIKKLGPDNQWHEIAATAMFTEYYGTGPLWKSKPHVMLAKCSEALALRKGFPSDLSGVYTQEEMEKEVVIDETMHANQNCLATSTDHLPISKAQADEIECLLADEEADYRLNLLKYFSDLRKLPVPMKDFSDMPNRFYTACMKSIYRRRDERLKPALKVTDQSTEEVMS